MVYYLIMNNIIFSKSPCVKQASTDRILFVCGILLGAAEIYKQLFLFYIINNRSYDWWFFPFQLCSLPMYLCLVLPFLPSCRQKTALYTFVQDYGLLGGIGALIVPDGFCHIHWTLTLHGYAWHILLIFISLLIRREGRSSMTWRGFAGTIPPFLLFCLVATAVNLLAPGHGQADMFYISPYTYSSQPLFHTLSLRLGITASNLLYLLTIIAGAAAVHFLLEHIPLRRQ